MRLFAITSFAMLSFCTGSYDLGAQVNLNYYVGGGVGVTARGESLPDGNIYRSTLYVIQGGWNMTPRKYKFPLLLIFETNAGVSNLSTRGKQDYEFAATVGLETLFPIGKSIALSASASTGPGYFAADIDQQSEGFIFSNNLVFSILIKLTESGFYLKPAYRFRHMSSADFTLPNYGVDHHFVVLTAGMLLAGSSEEER